MNSMIMLFNFEVVIFEFKEIEGNTSKLFDLFVFGFCGKRGIPNIFSRKKSSVMHIVGKMKIHSCGGRDQSYLISIIILINGGRMS